MAKKRKKTAEALRQEKKLKQKKRRRRRRAFLLLELFLLAGLSVAAYAMFKYDKMEHQILDDEELEIYEDTGDYTNIALFGLDSREGELEGGVQSDCIMIASINNGTKEVKLVSVYRDTLLQQADGTYEKANSAYNFGGPAEAIALLNRNFDLDIEKYISVNFNALADAIDALGGIDLEMTEEEVFWTNGYCNETSQVVGRETTELSGAGVHHVDGIQAVSYARIRYTEGNDFKRTERQRIVLEKTAEKAQQANIITLNNLLDQVLPQVSTNLTAGNLMAMAKDAAKYKIGEMSGFPFEVTTSDSILKHSGSYVVPVGLADNVSALHEFLFGETDYVPSDLVQSINNDIIYLSGISPDTDEEAEESWTDDSSSGGTEQY